MLLIITFIFDIIMLYLIYLERPKFRRVILGHIFGYSVILVVLSRKYSPLTMFAIGQSASFVLINLLRAIID